MFPLRTLLNQICFPSGLYSGPSSRPGASVRRTSGPLPSGDQLGASIRKGNSRMTVWVPAAMSKISRQLVTEGFCASAAGASRHAAAPERRMEGSVCFVICVIWAD